MTWTFGFSAAAIERSEVRAKRSSRTDIRPDKVFIDEMFTAIHRGKQAFWRWAKLRRALTSIFYLLEVRVRRNLAPPFREATHAVWPVVDPPKFARLLCRTGKRCGDATNMLELSKDRRWLFHPPEPPHPFPL